MASDHIIVEVAYATPKKQLIIPVKVSKGTNIKQAIEKSGIQKEFADIDLNNNHVGIFGKKTTLDHVLDEKDRIEIYRPLIIDPKEQRRKKAADKKKKKKESN